MIRGTFNSESVNFMDELAQIQKEIESLQKKAEEIVSLKKTEIIEEIKDKIKAYGLTAKDLGLSSSERDGNKGLLVPIKYRKDKNTWTGRGKKPRWVVDHLAQGGTMEDLLVK
jgi:DNA-binding protein H-NS